MIRRIEHRKLGEDVYLFEHVKATQRHIKMLCGLKPGVGIYLRPWDSYYESPDSIHPCLICQSKAVGHTFFAEED